MTKSYTVKSATILHNKTPYGIGSTIKLIDPEAEKLIDYIVPLETKPQSLPPASTNVTDTTADKNATSTTKKSNKKSDKSAPASDSSDASTITNDVTPIADTDTASSSSDSVSAEDTSSDAVKQETKNAKAVQTSSN